MSQRPWLNRPETIAQVDRWLADDEREKQQQIREENERIYLRAVANWFRRQETR